MSRYAVYFAKASDGYERVWRTRKDGVRQRYRKARYVIYRQPKLSRLELPGSPEIPNDALLRGTSAQEVVGALVKWFYAQPAHAALAKPRLYFPTSQTAFVARLTANVGVPKEDLPRVLPSYAVSNPGKKVVCLAPITALRLGSKDIGQRLRGAETVLHELCHVSLPYPAPNRPIEEGSTTLYTDALLHQALGVGREIIEPEGQRRPYQDWTFAAAYLLSTLGASPAQMLAHLQRLRTTRDGALWLQAELLARSRNPSALDAIFAPGAENMLRSDYSMLARSALEGGDPDARAYR